MSEDANRVPAGFLRVAELHVQETVEKVAHDVRNALAGVQAALQVIHRRRPPGGVEGEAFEAMEQRLGALDDLVSSLAAGTRQREAAETVELESVLRQVIVWVESNRANPIELQVSPARTSLHTDRLRLELLCYLLLVRQDVDQVRVTGGTVELHGSIRLGPWEQGLIGRVARALDGTFSAGPPLRIELPQD